MKKQFIYRGIRAFCLLACLGLVWLAAGDGILPGKTTGREKRHTPGERGEALEEQVLEAFSRWIVKVEKVSWEPEELVDRMREKMERWQEYSRTVTGYIHIFTDPPGHGSLRGYAVIYEGDYHYLDKQYTFLLTDDGIYQIFSKVYGPVEWRGCMRKLLQSVPQWRITKEESRSYVHSFATNKKALYRYAYNDADRISVWYDGMNFAFPELLECQGSVEETGDQSLRIRFWNPKGDQEREMQVRAVEMPVYDTYEEWREYLQALHPELRGCYFCTRTVGEYCADPFIMLETEEIQYGYFQWEGRWYQICFDIPGDGGYFYMELRDTCAKMGYVGSIPSYWWRMDEKGNIIEADLMEDVYWLMEEISPGQIFSFECTMVRAQENDIWDEKVYQVAVTAQGEEEPFQVFEVESGRGHGDGFSSWDFEDAFYFVDFNADGYRDLESLYYYGANSGSVITFVWSPSQGEFVRMPEELGNWDYRVYPETRRLEVYYRGGAASGQHELYQWSGEMDYELIRYREYEYEDVWDEEDNLVGELYHEKIVAVDQGREKVLADYTYDFDDDSSNYVGLLYDLDVAWEKKVVVTGQNKSCILRYAQDKAVIDEDGQEEVYQDYLFLFREDTYLICALPEQEAPAAYADIVWEKEAQRLVVGYENGMAQGYRWNGAEFILETGE